jgi:hypothetical protein
MLTASIVNKILHAPTVRMKEAAGRDECYLYVDAVRTLFELNGNGAAEGSPAADDAVDAPSPAARADHEARSSETGVDGCDLDHDDA